MMDDRIDLYYGKMADGQVVFGTLQNRPMFGKTYILNLSQTQWEEVDPESVRLVRDIPTVALSTTLPSGEKQGYVVTEEFWKDVQQFIAECEAQRKEILDAGLDTDEFPCPTWETRLEDVCFTGFDLDGSYYNCLGITEEYSSGPFGCFGFVDYDGVYHLFSDREQVLHQATNLLTMSTSEIYR